MTQTYGLKLPIDPDDWKDDQERVVEIAKRRLMHAIQRDGLVTHPDHIFVTYTPPEQVRNLEDPETGEVVEVNHGVVTASAPARERGEA